MQITVYKSDPNFTPLAVVFETMFKGKKYTSGICEMRPNEWNKKKEAELKRRFEQDVLSQNIKRPK